MSESHVKFNWKICCPFRQRKKKRKSLVVEERDRYMAPLSHIEWTPLSLCIDHERNNILLTFFLSSKKTSTWTWAYLNLFFFFSLPLILCAIFTPHTGSSYTYVCTWCTSVKPVCTTHTRIPPYPYLNIGRPKRKYIKISWGDNKVKKSNCVSFRPSSNTRENNI